MILGTPWMLLLLPLVALAGGLMVRARRLQREAVCRLKGVAPAVERVRLGRSNWLTLAALGCVVLALARPQWNPRPHQLERRSRDLVIALDVSRSMLAADVLPSRLEAARIAILEALPELAGQRIALVTFAGSAAVRVPLTLDHGFVRYMLERADPSEADLGSTSLQAAVEKAVGSVLTDASGGGRDLVIFTDGEDHLSNLDKTAAMLADCGARVLLVGLGDPVEGARVPASSGDDAWMRHGNAVVVSRLHEETLMKLAAKSPRVTYYPARTRPIDVVPLYQKMIAGSTGDAVVGGLQTVRYTEGYPYLLALAVGLCLAASPWRLSAARHLVVLLLLLPGCAPTGDGGSEALYRAKLRQGDELFQHAQEQAATDGPAARSLLADAREAFLRAALLRPGDRQAARRITAVTRRLHEVDAAIERERAEEKKRREDLGGIIRRLEALTVRQVGLSEQSRQLLRRRPQPPSKELNRLAGPVRGEQQAVQEEASGVLESLTFQQDSLRKMLGRAYGTSEQLPTELDPAAGLLAEAADAQQQALAALGPEAVRWPKANTALHAAAGRMQQALESLRSLQPPTANQDDKVQPPMSDSDYDEDLEPADADGKGGKSKAASPADLKAALSLRWLPLPNYTSDDILAEESANQQQRARRKAARAGAKVEKNW